MVFLKIMLFKKNPTKFRSMAFFRSSCREKNTGGFERTTWNHNGNGNGNGNVNKKGNK